MKSTAVFTQQSRFACLNQGFGVLLDLSKEIRVVDGVFGSQDCVTLSAEARKLGGKLDGMEPVAGFNNLKQLRKLGVHARTSSATNVTINKKNQ